MSSACIVFFCVEQHVLSVPVLYTVFPPCFAWCLYDTVDGAITMVRYRVRSLPPILGLVRETDSTDPRGTTVATPRTP